MYLIRTVGKNRLSLFNLTQGSNRKIKAEVYVTLCVYVSSELSGKILFLSASLAAPTQAD